MVAASVSGRQDRNLNQMALRSLNLCVFGSSGAYEQSRRRAPVSSPSRHDQGKETRVAYEVFFFFLSFRWMGPSPAISLVVEARKGGTHRTGRERRKEKGTKYFCPLSQIVTYIKILENNIRGTFLGILDCD